MRSILTTGLLALLAAMALAPAALADHRPQPIGPQNPDDPQVDSPWQAGTCKTDPPPPGQCSVATPSLFFEEAAGHPPKGFTQFIVNSETVELIPLVPITRPRENVRTVRVDIPPGFTVNPEATAQCDPPEGSPSECGADSKVGFSEVEVINAETGLGPPPLKADVHSLKPSPGEPAKFGFSLVGNDIFLETDIAWEDDFHEYFTIHAHKLEVPPIPGELARVARNRLVFDGMAGNGTFLTTPTTCFGEATPGSPFEHLYSTWLRADSFESPEPNFPTAAHFVESKIPPGTEPKNCGDIPYEPSLEADPATAQTDSPSGASVTVNLPEIPNPLKEEDSKSTSHTRSATATLPLGMGLNPSAAAGLVACTDAQFGKGTRNPVACPAASDVGDVAVETPPLPAGAVTGQIFIGQQLSRDPASGDAYRIFVTAESAQHDISARLLGKVRADPQTGQLTTTIDDGPLGKVTAAGLPQVPFTAFKLDFNDGERAPLTSPATCGPHTASTTMTPWSGNAPETAADDFELSSAPGGGACPETLAARPFAPGFGAAVDRPRGGDFSPFTVNITRGIGQQEVKGADVALPPGLSAKLAGLKYCPEAAIAAAATRSAAEESAASSCPAKSFVGSAVVHSGSGAPLVINGKAFLAGPYRGAPLSLAIVTPAAAGPFDLGSVVTRVALFVHRETAQVTAVSDPIPHVFGGALLDIGLITIRLDRKNFSLNPTNCSPMLVGAAIKGGGGNPADPAAFSSVPAGAPFQVNNCDRLDFRPKIFFRLFGAMRRAKNPKFRAVVMAKDGEANIARAVTTLPRSLILDQGNIGNVCTRVQYAANDCPRRSFYGHATAFSPLLDDPISGPVLLRSSDNLLPDIVASLRGQIDIDLVGRTDAVKGRIRNSFDLLPDVPVSKFVLVVRGGKRGILVNSRSQCPRKKKRKGRASSSKRRKPMRGFVRFVGHNGKKVKLKPKVRRACGKKKKRRKRSTRRHIRAVR